MKRQIAVLLISLLAVTIEGLAAQTQEGRDTQGFIRGRVLDSELQFPLEYANIVLYDKTSKAQITGTITDKDGNFRLTGINPGIYYMEVNFIGYHASTIDPIEIKADQTDIDLSIIPLRQAVIPLKEIQVEAERPDIEFKIDKKVINVSKEYTAVSGTAVDVLEKVPSVTVDIEGNVELRGSSNFTVLIDNRPTVLESNEVLQQIPASTIDNIEIITNPSAKYDPEGVSGIINIITKKKKSRGESGIINLNAGLIKRYGGDFLLNHRRTNFNVYFGVDYNKRVYPGTFQAESRTFIYDTTSFIYSSGSSRWGRTFFGLRGGIDLNLSNNDVWGLALRYGGRAMKRFSELDFDEWTEPGGIHNLYISEGNSKNGGDFYSANMDYCHTFEKKGHEISGQLNFSRRGGDEESTTELLDMDGLITSGQQSTEGGPSTRLRIRLDYSLPLSGKNQFEAGYQSRFSRSEEITTMHDYNPTLGEYEFKSDYSHTVEYNRYIQSLFATYLGELGRFGYQGGIRGEYTYRFIELMGENESFSIDRWDFFPTVHFSFEYSKMNQMMASYTRRIERTRGWYLEPFLTWSDAYNVRRGNPDLKPEYIDSYEIGHQMQLGRSQLSSEVYYRVTHNKVERVRSVYDANVMLHTIENVGTDYTFGTELMLNLEQFKWWNLNLMGNLYDYRIRGVLYGEPFSQESFNWRTRINNTFNLGRATRIQIDGIYNSPTVSAQGRREGFFVTNVAVRQYILNRSLSATLQVRDIFSTAKFEYTSEGTDFYSYRQSTRQSPMVTLTITYNFNNYKQERRPDEIQEEFEGEENFQ
jgi:hypothetical protein